MDRLRHYFAVLGLVAGVISLGLPWASFQLSSGVTGTIAWGDVSAGSVSFAVAAAAAWALTLLVGPAWRRALGVAVVVLASNSAAFALMSLSRAGEIVLSRAESEAGVIGAFSIDDVLWSWSVAGPTLSMGSVSAFVLSGLALIAWPGARRGKDRYEREKADPWEQLSRGDDPTER
jgi:hypothetical protein